MFGLSAPQCNEALLRDAGFTDVVSQELRGTMHFESPDDYWTVQSSLAGPVRAAVASLATDELVAVQATVAEMLEPFRSGDGFDLPTTLVVAAAS